MEQRTARTLHWMIIFLALLLFNASANAWRKKKVTEDSTQTTGATKENKNSTFYFDERILKNTFKARNVLFKRSNEMEELEDAKKSITKYSRHKPTKSTRSTKGTKPYTKSTKPTKSTRRTIKSTKPTKSTRRTIKSTKPTKSTRRTIKSTKPTKSTRRTIKSTKPTPFQKKTTAPTKRTTKRTTIPTTSTKKTTIPTTSTKKTTIPTISSTKKTTIPTTSTKKTTKPTTSTKKTTKPTTSTKKTVIPTTYTKKATIPSTSTKKTTKPTTSTKKTTKPTASTKKTVIPTTSTKKATIPTTSTKKTTIPSTSTKKTTMPATSTKKTTILTTSTKKTTIPTTSTKKTTIPATSTKKTTILTTSTKKTTIPTTSTKKTTIPITSTKKTSIPATSTKKTTRPTTSTKKTTIPTTSTKKTAIPITSTKKTTTPSTRTTIPTTSTKKTTIPATSTKKTARPITSTKKTTIPTTSTKKTGIPATSTKKTTIPTTSTKKTTIPTTSTKKTTIPATSTKKTAIPITSTKKTTTSSMRTTIPTKHTNADVTVFTDGLKSTQSVYKKPETFSNKKVSAYVLKLKTLGVQDPKSLDEVANITEMLLKNLRTDAQCDKNQSDTDAILTATSYFEDFANQYARYHFKDSAVNSVTINRTGSFVLSIFKIPKNTRDDLQFPTRGDDGFKTASLIPKVGTFITLPSKLFADKDRIVVSAVYVGMSAYISSKARLDNNSMYEADRKQEINSDIISSTLDPSPTEDVLPENVTIFLQHIQELSPTEQRTHCVFWDVRERNALGGMWSDIGCTMVQSNKTMTICTCNHLTSFALLMQVKQGKPVDETHKQALSHITYVGCSFSLLGEVLTVVVYMTLMNIRLEQSQIRVNLAFSLALAQIFFLSGMTSTENKNICTFVAVMIHYFFLVTFGWMMFEGVYLYLMVVKVFNTVVRMKFYYVFSWGFPLVVVLTSLGIASSFPNGLHSYTQQNFCWVSSSNGLVWTFVAPVLIISLMNVVILGRVVRELATLNKTNSKNASSYIQSIKACVVLFPLLGLTWVFGILMFIDAGLVFQYIFTILNSFQGFLIFVFHVLRSGDVRAAFRRKLQRWQLTRKVNFSCSRLTTDSSAKYSHGYQLKHFKSTESLQKGHRRHNRILPLPLNEEFDTKSAVSCVTPVEDIRNPGDV